MKVLNLFRVLLAPDGGGGGGGAEGSAQGASDTDAATFSAVLGRLGLPGISAVAEQGKAPEKPKEKAPVKAEAAAEQETPEAEEVETPAEETAEDTEHAEGEAEAEAAAEDVAKVKGELEAAQAKLATLEAELQTARTQPAEMEGIHPLFYEDDPKKLAAAEAQIAQFERWAVANWDGMEAVPASEDGKTPAKAGYTAAQVRAKYSDLKELREKILPAARAAASERLRDTEAAKAEYPALFDPKTTEYAAVQGILARAPALKAIIPNIYLVIGDAIEGEKARVAKAKAKAAAAKPGTPAKSAPAKPGAAKVPARPSAGGTAAGAAKKPEKGMDVNAKRFMELGGDRGALVKLLQGTNLPMGKE